MRIQLPSADHRLLLYDRGSALEWPPGGAAFPMVYNKGLPEVFKLIQEVHWQEGHKALYVPVVGAALAWPGQSMGTALMRSRWGIPEIAWVSVQAGCRGFGLGRRLVESLLTTTASRYVCAVTSNPSVVPFWEKCGFKVAEEIPDAAH